MARLFALEIHTPYRLFYSGQVESFVATLTDGSIGVYSGHSPFTGVLADCVFRILDAEGTWKEAAVSAGVLIVTGETATVLSDAAEWPDEIDSKRAEDAKRRAEERLGESIMKYEAVRARASLARARNRLEVLAHSVIHP